MSTQQSTCWTVIRAAAAGSPADREELAHRYLAVVRAYLAARRRGSPLRPDLDHAVQKVFIECFRQDVRLDIAIGKSGTFRKVGVINIPTMEFLRGWSPKGIADGLVDETSQELALPISKQHDQYLGSKLDEFALAHAALPP